MNSPTTTWIWKSLTTVMLLSFFAGLWMWKQPAPTKQMEMSSLDSRKFNLLQETRNILAELRNNTVFNAETCVSYIQETALEVHKIGPEPFFSENLSTEYPAVMKEFWAIRQELRNKLVEFNTHTIVSQEKICSEAIREALRTVRYMEDYLGELYSGAKEFKEDKDPKALSTLQGTFPTLALADGEETLKIRSGDVIISRGNAYTSAAISRIGIYDSQFSHLAFVYVEGDGTEEFTIEEAKKSNRVLVLEAHIETGSSMRPMREYLADGNYRNAVYRYKDTAVAHQAATESFQFLKKRSADSYKKNPIFSRRDVNHNIPYDFKMDMGDADEIFCSEIASYGFGKVGVQIPLFRMTLEHKNDLVKRMGIKVKETFAPGDIEIDPRFKMMAEYRDFRKSKNIRMKDAVLVAMFRWMNQKGYKFYPDAKVALSSVMGWTLRQTDLGYRKKLPKNMDMKVMNTVMTLDQIAGALEKHLRKKDQEYFKQKGLLIPYKDAQEILDQYREVDAQKSDSDFHFWFHN